jgi:hypothetical protein
MKQGIQFRFVANSYLPKLAWCMHLHAGHYIATVIHGEWVETSVDGFFEGAWSGELSDKGFDEAFMTGTGGKTCREGILLATPNHTLDRINVLRKADDLYVSNSMAYLLAISGEDLNPYFPFYDSCISSIKFGLKGYERTITTNSGVQVRFFYACNVIVSPDLAWNAMPKKSSPRFDNFKDYRSHLDNTIERIARNANEPRRNVRYIPLATVSRGYDSPAAMVLAKAAGCREAFTFRVSRGALTEEDCGTVIASHVGMRVREFDRLEYCSRSDFPEILNSGGPNEFLSFGENLGGKLLFTGFHGDKVWDKNCEKVARDLVRGDASGASLTELRLKVGFCHLPVPFIGADSHPSIHVISNSGEMERWSLHNFYDRPIPRRIVEECGVPRDLFGQEKRAAGVVVPEESLARTMSPTSFIDFQKVRNEHRNTMASFKTHCMKVIKRFVYYNEGAAKLAARIRFRTGLRFIKVPFVVPHKLTMLSYGYLGKEAYLLHWGTGILISRYKAALEEAPSVQERVPPQEEQLPRRFDS